MKKSRGTPSTHLQHRGHLSLFPQLHTARTGRVISQTQTLENRREGRDGDAPKMAGQPRLRGGRAGGTCREDQRGDVGACVPLAGGFGTPGSNSSLGRDSKSQSGLAGEDVNGDPRGRARGPREVPAPAALLGPFLCRE